MRRSRHTDRRDQLLVSKGRRLEPVCAQPSTTAYAPQLVALIPCGEAVTWLGVERTAAATPPVDG